MEQGQGDTRAESWGGEPIALLADRMQAAAEGFSTWCDSHKGLLIALFSLFHFGVLLLVAQHTQFWFDELFTYYIALLPTVPDILSELGKAVDHHPPAYFLLNRFVAGLFSDPHIGFRIPAIAGFWMLCVGLFLYVSRRSSAVFGLLAICLAHISGARYWATEARPYSLAAGLGTVALVAWQMATDKQKRTSWLIALALSLVAAVSVSYYSVLLLIPLAVAEAVRTMRRGKADLPVWFSLAAGAASGIVYLPAVRQSVEIFNPNNWARPRAGTIPGIYASFFASLMFFMLGALLVVAVLHVFRLWAVESRYAGGERKVRPEDLALGIGLLLLPVAGMAAALLVTHMLTARYVISTVAGFCILVPLLAFNAARGRAAAGVALLAVGGLFCLLSNASAVNHALEGQRGIVADINGLLARVPQDAGSDLPVVFEDTHRLLEACHYSDKKLSSRLLLLTYPEAALKYSGVYYTGRGLFLLQRYAPFRVEHYSVFRRKHNKFLYFETNGGKHVTAFMMPTLQAEGARIRFLAKEGLSAIYLVEGSE